MGWLLAPVLFVVAVALSRSRRMHPNHLHMLHFVIRQPLPVLRLQNPINVGFRHVLVAYDEIFEHIMDVGGIRFLT